MSPGGWKENRRRKGGGVSPSVIQCYVGRAVPVLPSGKTSCNPCTCKPFSPVLCTVIGQKGSYPCFHETDTLMEEQTVGNRTILSRAMEKLTWGQRETEKREVGASIRKWSGWHLRTPPEKGAPLPATSCCLMAKTTRLSGNFSPRAPLTPQPVSSLQEGRAPSCSG